jgi:hypothetical protein
VKNRGTGQGQVIFFLGTFILRSHEISTLPSASRLIYVADVVQGRLNGNVMKRANLHLFGLALGLALAVGTSNRASSATAYTNAVLADNPVVYWNFDEADGDAIDQVNGLAADTLVGGASAARVASTTNGGGISLGSAASLSGAGGAKWTAANLTHDGGATQWAIEFWAQSSADTLSDFRYVLGGGGNGNDPAILHWGGQMQYYPNGGGVQGAGLATPNSSSWTHYVFVVDSDGQTAAVYLDGDLWGDQNLGNPADPHPFGRQVIGGHNPSGGGENFVGLIDEVAIYDLSNAGDLGAAGQRIANHYNVPEPASIALLGLGGLLMLRRRRGV